MDRRPFVAKSLFAGGKPRDQLSCGKNYLRESLLTASTERISHPFRSLSPQKTQRVKKGRLFKQAKNLRGETYLKSQKRDTNLPITQRISMKTKRNFQTISIQNNSNINKMRIFKEIDINIDTINPFDDKDKEITEFILNGSWNQHLKPFDLSELDSISEKNNDTFNSLSNKQSVIALLRGIGCQL